MKGESKGSTIKNGDSTTYKRQDRAFKEHEKISVAERTERHQLLHPNDKNERKERGITRSKVTKRDRELKEFYKTHTYTWTSMGSRTWVALPTGDENASDE